MKQTVRQKHKGTINRQTKRYRKQRDRQANIKNNKAYHKTIYKTKRQLGKNIKEQRKRQTKSNDIKDLTERNRKQRDIQAKIR